MRIMRLVAMGTVVCVALASIGCSTPKGASESTPAQDGVVRLKAWMTGSFTSTEQAAVDAEYFDIRLHIVPIWIERNDGPWLYVEQARADALEKPYRQRVYRLSAVDQSTFKSEVYEFVGDPVVYAGAWKDKTPLSKLAPESLKLKDGCAVVLKWQEGTEQFIGGTVGKGCPSGLRGAAYATSEVTLANALLLSWDRGYDAQDQQVWGATKGGYRFLREVPTAPSAKAVESVSAKTKTDTSSAEKPSPEKHAQEQSSRRKSASE